MNGHTLAPERVPADSRPFDRGASGRHLSELSASVQHTGMTSSRKRKRPSRRGGGGGHEQHTSVPTGRAAYAETRRWLLATHGPVCAYCGSTFPARTMTLDHVTPRRGQSAFDRRDNLVLACKTCNSRKADKSFLAWVLGSKTRARHLYLYGQHLSAGILDILRPMAGDVVIPARAPAPRRKARHVFGAEADDGASPYSDEPSPYLDETPARPGVTPAPPGRPAKSARTRRSPAPRAGGRSRPSPR